MDNNSTDPNSPAPVVPGLGQPAGMPPTDPANAPWQIPIQPNLPQSPPIPVLNPDQPQSVPASNSWDVPNTISPQQPDNTNPSEMPIPPISPTPLPESPWPSSTQIQNFGSAPLSSPAVPEVTTNTSLVTPPVPDPSSSNPVMDNPFLQTQNPTGQPPAPETPQIPGPTAQSTESSTPQQPGETPQETQSNQLGTSTFANPMQTPDQGVPVQESDTANIASSQNPSQDPLNTAFSPVPNASETNPFSQPLTQPPANLVSNQPQTPEAILPADNSQTPREGTSDLSSIQPNSNSSAGGTETQSVSPLPEMGPQENAPTDLSHLIAGDETHQQPGEIYNPPVTGDQTPPVNNSQPPAGIEAGAAPQGKHLNLTKVLIIAGIPIILIVAGLSAYLILGIGKAAPQTSQDQTSLPVEQTKQQAPLTNPPQQITAPSPAAIPEPQTQGVGLTNGSESSGSGVALPKASSSPAASLSPAMQAALKKASPSPSSASVTTPPATP